MTSWLKTVREALLVDPSKGVNGKPLAEQEQRPVEQANPAPTAEPGDQPLAAVVAGDPVPEFTQKYVAQLTSKISGQKSPYTELNEIMASTAAVLPDEEVRLKAAFAVLAKNGITVQVLLASIDEHLASIKQAKDDLVTAATSETEGCLSMLSQQKRLLEDGIAQHRHEIDRIRQEADRRLAEEQAAVEQKSTQLTDAEQKLSGARASLDQANTALTESAAAMANELTASRNKVSALQGA